MQFIDDRFFPSAPTPAAIIPIEGKGIDHFAGPMHIPRLKAGGWVGDFVLAVNPKIVSTPGLGCINDKFKPTLVAMV